MPSFRIRYYIANKPSFRYNIHAMKKHPTVVFLGDGMADEPVPALGSLTPLQAAKTPAMDTIARMGRSGTLLTLPDGYPTSSDVANMSVLGGDLATELCGRGPLEAASQGIEMGADDVVFRMNLVSVAPDGTLADFSGGHVGADEQHEAIALLNAEIADNWQGSEGESVRFFAGVSYRNLLRLRGKAFTGTDVACDKPDDNSGNPVAEHLPRAKSPAGEYTADVLRDIIARASSVLAGRGANGVWPWSGGKAGAIHSIPQRYGIRGAIVAAVDVINGLGRAMGLDVIRVEGATGYIDTNYEGKADAALKALADGYDFVYVHIESTDEVSHARDLSLKIKTIEDFDSRLIARVLGRAPSGTAFAVLPDHPVPLSIGRHTRTPVPVAVWQPGVEPDSVMRYSEIDAPHGALGAMKGSDLMDLLLRG